MREECIEEVKDKGGVEEDGRNKIAGIECGHLDEVLGMCWLSQA